ncbi:hypothetical protein HDV02_003638 [Globomyces sp. JEL0801]|nr:hypothetical protein HDV02_003638 [Globomyces sp. JEL0801]
MVEVTEESTPSPITFPAVTKQDIDYCSIIEWYPKFSRYSIPTVFVPLSEEFISYLSSDSVYVAGMNTSHSYEYDVDSDSDSSNSEVDSHDSTNLVEFPELDLLVEKAVEELGGSIFPKLNWSSPKDAAWIAFGNSLECTKPADIYILLKSSDFIIHDLFHAYEYCQQVSESPQFNLALREWRKIDSAYEFRCFIRNNQLIDVLDVYCTNQFYVRIVDFNPFIPSTDPLLFEWSELLVQEFNEPVFRYNKSADEAQSNQPAYTHNRLPKEAFDFSENSTIAEFAQRFQQELELQARNNEHVNH